MTVSMQTITVYSVKVASEPHSTPETVGTRCHGCSSLSCIAQRSRLHPWRYWCEAAHRQILDFDGFECPASDAPKRILAPFCEWLSGVLDAKGLTQADLARMLRKKGSSTTRQSVSKYASGQQVPYMPTRQLIYHVLGSTWPGEAHWRTSFWKGER